MNKVSKKEGRSFAVIILMMIIIMCIGLIIIEVAQLIKNSGNGKIDNPDVGGNVIDIPSEDNENKTDNDEVILISEAQSKILSTTKNVRVQDEFGNIIIVPAGFKITMDSKSVIDGIVIEDATGSKTNGSQFVWIPVGNVYTTTDEVKDSANTKNIKLSRYTFSSAGVAIEQGDMAIREHYKELEVSTYGNSAAKSLKAFIASVEENGGYYIGRYEARTNESKARTSGSDALTTLTCVKTNAVYNYVTQSQASELSKNMYSTDKFTSDLVNSYAWDTALLYIKMFSNDANYASKSSLNSEFMATGTNTDVKCNIYDMASNCYEWTTETYTAKSTCCVYRGGCYNAEEYASDRRSSLNLMSGANEFSFRPIIYLEK